MSEIMGFSIICVLLAWNVIVTLQDRKERRDLLNRIVARNAGEIRMLEDRPPIVREPIQLDPELRDFWEHGETIGS